MDNITIEEVYYKSGLRHFKADFKFLIKKVLDELYSSNCLLLYNIELKHVDRAIFKYTEACKKKKIYNTKNYFKACLESSIAELGIDETVFDD